MYENIVKIRFWKGTCRVYEYWNSRLLKDLIFYVIKYQRENVSDIMTVNNVLNYDYVTIWNNSVTTPHTLSHYLGWKYKFY